ncbi:uncharacterized protein LOC144440491 [Glandiceps talaboti]
MVLGKRCLVFTRHFSRFTCACDREHLEHIALELFILPYYSQPTDNEVKLFVYIGDNTPDNKQCIESEANKLRCSQCDPQQSIVLHQDDENLSVRVTQVPHNWACLVPDERVIEASLLRSGTRKASLPFMYRKLTEVRSFSCTINVNTHQKRKTSYPWMKWTQRYYPVRSSTIEICVAENMKESATEGRHRRKESDGVPTSHTTQSRLDPFYIFLLNLSECISQDEHVKIKRILNGNIPKADLEQCKDSFGLFDKLKERAIITPSDLKLLIDIFDGIGRGDLAIRVKGFVDQGGVIP